MAGPTNEELLEELTKQWSDQFGLDLGGGSDKPKPLTITAKGNVLQDFVQILSNIRPGLDPSFATNFLTQNPELVSQLYSNFDVASQEGLERFTKVMLDLERMGALGTNLGQKAGTLSQSVTTRTLSPSEAEAIFNLELNWQMAQKQAPLKAAEWLAPGFVPQSFAGSSMPGFEEGGIYRQLLPGMNPEMFKYQPTAPGAVEEIARMFTPTENEAMQMARQALMNALQTGISSTSTTNTISGGGGGGAPAMPSPSALMSAYYGSGAGQPYQPFGPTSAPFGPPLPPGMEPPPTTSLPSLQQQAAQSGQGNPLLNAWNSFANKFVPNFVIGR